MMQSDNLHHYGTISRVLHWLMALGFGFMLFTSLSLTFAGEAEWTNGFRNYHKIMGYFLMILVIVRVLWTLFNSGKRPPAHSTAAHLGHLALYAVMIAVPLVGLLRQYGAARGALTIGDITLLPAAPERVDWLVKLGSQWHNLLAWTLFALAAGHIVMVIVHRIKGDDVLPRMLGNKARH